MTVFSGSILFGKRGCWPLVLDHVGRFSDIVFHACMWCGFAPYRRYRIQEGITKHDISDENRDGVPISRAARLKVACNYATEHQMRAPSAPIESDVLSSSRVSRYDVADIISHKADRSYSVATSGRRRRDIFLDSFHSFFKLLYRIINADVTTKEH
jgi:hypothetical protein